MNQENCEICAFNNPKATVTAIIIKDNKLLLLKRNEEPFKNCWDLPGGFLEQGETPEEAVVRELKEELGISRIALTCIKTLPDTYTWKEKKIPIVSHFYTGKGNPANS